MQGIGIFNSNFTFNSLFNVLVLWFLLNTLSSVPSVKIPLVFAKPCAKG